MGCFVSLNSEDSKNAAIDSTLLKERKENKRAVKLLLIGSGDSGKTTIRKQIRSIYGGGIDIETRTSSREVIWENIISGTRQLMSYAIRSDPELSNQSIEKKFGEDGLLIWKISKKTDLKALQANEVEVFKRLWLSNPEFKDAYEHRKEYHLQDCWVEFVESLVSKYPEWGGDDWIPSPDDCIRARVRTSGITEEVFEIDQVTFKIFDCGGQRAERKKWIHFFDNVTTVLFVASLSEYDLYLFEDHSVPRLQDSIELFSDMCNSRFFKDIPMIIFLNKRDLFEKKLVQDKVPLNATGQFPTAPDTHDPTEAIQWITSMYLAKNLNPQKQIFAHVTTAVDRGNVKAVFDTCKNIILQKNLEAIGFMM